MVVTIAHGQAPDVFEQPVVVDVPVGVFRPAVGAMSLTTDGQGTWLGAWSRYGVSGSDSDLFFTRSIDDGITWSPSAVLNTDAATDTDTQGDNLWMVRMGGGGTTVAVWNRYQGSYDEALFARSTDAGLSWSPPVRLDQTMPVSSEEPDVRALATDGAGTWVATLHKPIPPEPGSGLSHSIVQLVRSDDDGVTWSTPVDLTDRDRRVSSADIAASGAGTFVVTWNDEDGIRVARSTDGGITWSSPPAIGPGTDGKIATDGSGTWLVHVGTSLSLPTGLVYRSVDDGVTWAAGVPVTGAFRTLLLDGGGNALLVGGDELLRSTDGGVTWASPVVPVIPFWTMATDGAGEWIGIGRLAEENDPVFVARGRTVCPAAPAGGCFTASPGDPLVIKQPLLKKRDTLSWRWKRGDAVSPAALGDPTQTDAYVVCAYDGTGNVVLAAEAPAGGVCGTKPCWTVSSKGVKYRNTSLVPDGIKLLKAKSGALGTTTVSVKARGEWLTLPVLDPLRLQLPLTLQMHAATGSCWESTYASTLVNKPGELKARSD